MSPSSAQSSVSSHDALRVQMERSIDDLAERARSGVAPGEFFSEVLRRALNPGGATHAVLWRLSLDGVWESAGELPAVESVGSKSQAQQDLLNEVARGPQPRIIGASSGINGVSHGETHVFSPLRHAGQTAGILETRHFAKLTENLSPATYQFFAAIGEITADFLSQQELQQLRVARTLWQQWDQFSQQLSQSLDLADVCAVIANDGRQLLGHDRISVLIRRSRNYQIEAATGVERVDPRAGAVRSLEDVALAVAHLNRTVWRTDLQAPSMDDKPGDACEQVIRRHAQVAGTVSLGAVPLFPVARDKGSPPLAVIVFEQFHVVADWTGQQARAESLVQRSAYVLSVAVERQSIPWLGLWTRLQRSPRIARNPISKLVLALIAVVIAALILVPSELTVTGHGEVWPSVQRDIFASSSGIVDQVVVEHGQDVQPGQPLVILRDLQLDQEIPKVIGELATLMERLRGVQTARLTGTTLPDPLLKSRQLAAEEEEIKERQKSLELQRKLLEDRQALLTLRSPIRGKVLTWDLAQHLSARPVDRGQVLLTVGQTEGPWILEIRVPDKEAGHVMRAWQANHQNLDVEFLLAADPNHSYVGKVRDIGLAAESDDHLNSFVRIIVEFDRSQIAQLRPGATAVPKIRCGRHSLGYVWLRDLIDAVRTRLLF